MVIRLVFYRTIFITRIKDLITRHLNTLFLVPILEKCKNVDFPFNEFKKHFILIKKTNCIVKVNCFYLTVAVYLHTFNSDFRKELLTQFKNYNYGDL